MGDFGGGLEVIYQTRDTVFHHISNTEKRVENTTRSGVFLTNFEVFDIVFSNSLIIHQEKTKKITTVVWICDPNYHKILPTLALNFSKNINHLRSHIKHSKVCFIRYPNTSKSFKLLLNVWISDETLSLVFDILHETL